MQNPSISIIVPIYNAEATLNRCIESLLKQTFINYELILINDGSKDDSLKICQEYQNKDDRIIVIDKQNGGVGSARNAGLDVAKGEFVTFMDADDWAEENWLNEMRIAISETDLVVTGFTKHKDNGETIREILSDGYYKREYYSPICKQLLEDIKMDYLWSMLFRKDIIDKYRIRMNEKINVMEDLNFILEYVTKTNSFKTSSCVAYHYNFSEQNKNYSYTLECYEPLLKSLSLLLKAEDQAFLFAIFISKVVRVLLNKNDKETFQRVCEILKKYPYKPNGKIARILAYVSLYVPYRLATPVIYFLSRL